MGRFIHQINLSIPHVHTKPQDISSVVKIMEKLSPEVAKKLLELIDMNIDINKIILEALDNREAEIAEAKDKEAEKQEQKEQKNRVTADTSAEKSASRHIPAKPASRHIPAGVRKIINAEQGDKCAMPNCKQKGEFIHHELPFAITKTHDPNNLKKLCRAHHELAHAINIKIYQIKKRAVNSS